MDIVLSIVLYGMIFVGFIAVVYFFVLFGIVAEIFKAILKIMERG